MEAERRRCGDFRPTRVMELTATPRGDNQPFRLTDREKSPPEELPHELSEPLHFAWQRLKAKKGIAFHRPDGEKEKVADRIAMLAKKYADDESGKAILVYVSSLEDHATVCKVLHGQNVQMLTGTLRGLERDRMANPRRETGCPIFARFLKPPKPEAGENERWKVTPKPGTVYLVCTSAGEVGIDISADHLVCDLAAFDRMAQRFGRVNRFGTGDAKIDVVHESTPDPKKENDPNDQCGGERWNCSRNYPWSALADPPVPLRHGTSRPSRTQAKVRSCLHTKARNPTGHGHPIRLLGADKRDRKAPRTSAGRALPARRSGPRDTGNVRCVA